MQSSSLQRFVKCPECMIIYLSPELNATVIAVGSLGSSIFGEGMNLESNENRILNEPWTRNRMELVWYSSIDGPATGPAHFGNLGVVIKCHKLIEIDYIWCLRRKLFPNCISSVYSPSTMHKLVGWGVGVGGAWQRPFGPSVFTR